MRTAQDWQFILRKCGVSEASIGTWGSVFAENIDDTTFRSEEDMTTFLGQVLHESGMLQHLEENLNYSAERLMAVWPKRFPTLDIAQTCARNPNALAEKVYGGRLGNDQPGDGSVFRGRGLLQLTGKANYKAAGDRIGVDLVASPDLLGTPKYALLSAIAWWKANITEEILSDHEVVTRKVNGGLIGLADRTRLTELAEGAMTC
jgi:putative chitinase